MPVSRTFQWPALGVAVVFIGGAGAFGQAKYRLHDRYSPGDTCTVDSSMDLSTMMTVSVPGNGDQQLPFSERQRASYREKILEVGDKGPTAVRRTYSVARAVTTDPYLNEHTKVSSFQGKTITLRRTGGQVTMTAVAGKLAEVDRKELAGELSHSDLDLFPDREVAPGDEWPVDTQDLASPFPGAHRAESKYQFVEAVPYAGHPCAKIHVTADLEGQVPNSDAPITIKLSGDLYHAIDVKRTLSADLSGPVTISGARTENGMTVRISGQGTMHIKEARHWLIVKGHPVAGGG
jgi:hypothetical protein